jgi:hypothetical protein
MLSELKRECSNYCKHMKGDTSAVPRYEGEGMELRRGRIHFYTKAMERMYGPGIEGKVSSCDYSIDGGPQDAGSAIVHFRIEVEAGPERPAYSIGRTVAFRFTYIIDANGYDAETGTVPAQPAWGPSRDFPFGIIPKKGKDGSAGSPNSKGHGKRENKGQPTSELQAPSGKFLKRGNPPAIRAQRMRIPRRA